MQRAQRALVRAAPCALDPRRAKAAGLLILSLSAGRLRVVPGHPSAGDERRARCQYQILTTGCRYFAKVAAARSNSLNASSRPTPVSRFVPLRTLLWEVATAAAACNDPAWDHTLPPAPVVEFDQRNTWCGASPTSRWVCLRLRRAATRVLVQGRARLATARRKTSTFGGSMSPRRN